MPVTNDMFKYVISYQQSKNPKFIQCINIETKEILETWTPEFLSLLQKRTEMIKWLSKSQRRRKKTSKYVKFLFEKI